MANSQDISRRGLLGAAAVAASALVIAGRAEAGNIPQKAVKYQDQPNNGHQCSGCKLFQPGPTADALGKCQSVAGDIHPDGWCVLWAAKAA
jgi:hypothetical protein